MYTKFNGVVKVSTWHVGRLSMIKSVECCIFHILLKVLSELYRIHTTM